MKLVFINLKKSENSDMTAFPATATVYTYMYIHT